jgi:hypothetical protein
VPAKVPALKLGGAVILLLAAIVVAGTDRIAVGMAAAAAAVLVGWGVRDLVVPVRLSADAQGVTVVIGIAGRRRLAWSDIDRIGVDTRPRFGVRTETLEIDTGESVHLFGAYDLGAPPTDVAPVLQAARAQSR